MGALRLTASMGALRFIASSGALRLGFPRWVLQAERAEHALWPAVTVAARAWRFAGGPGGGFGGGRYDRRPVQGFAFAALKVRKKRERGG